jgi:hypothetical protein
MHNVVMRTLLAAAMLVLSEPVFAVQRVFVASTGLDTSPCSITQ